jgi:hypothetical protein
MAADPRQARPRGVDQLVLPHWRGIAISVAVVVAMFGVAIKKSLRALSWLRVILWVAVVKILVVQLRLLTKGQTELLSCIRIMLRNALIAIPLAAYWSRSVHTPYLASFQRASSAEA